MYRDAERAQELNVQLFERTRASGARRPDLTVNDLSFLFEQLASVRGRDEERTRKLRHRYLGLLLNALRTPVAERSALTSSRSSWRGHDVIGSSRGAPTHRP